MPRGTSFIRRGHCGGLENLYSRKLGKSPPKHFTINVIKED
jgi:hypothetical protein